MRKKLVAAIALLTILPALPMATAAEPLRLLEDAAGDLSLQDLLTTPVPRGSMDLRYLDVVEGLEALTLTVGTQPDPGQTDQGQVNVWFRHNDANFRLNLQQRNAVAGWWWVYNLAREEPTTGAWSYISASPPSEPLASSRTEGWVAVTVTKADLADRDGAVPFVGRTLEDIWVESSGWGVDVQLRDRMPDSGVAREPFTFEQGPQQTGTIELWSASPSRASNGEATTFIYEVLAHNSGRDSLSLRFGGQDVPDGWGISFPTPVVELEPGETQAYPVLVQTPFRHTHGEAASVNITLGAGRDIGRTTLSVLYHSVPQPAGHHSTLYFHSDQSPDALTPGIHASGLAVWHRISMNAEANFDGDDKVPVPASTVNGGHAWSIWLDPVLMMGVDFDLARVGHLSVPIQAATPISDAALTGTLYLLWPGANGGWDNIPVATLEPAEPRDIARAELTILEAEVRPTPDSDLVPYREGANLALFLQLERSNSWAGTGPEKPELMPGAFMELPLNEYHDPIDEVFRSLQGISLEAIGPRQRAVNPGETVTFTAQLAFDGPATDFVLSLDGEHAGAAYIVGKDTLTAGGGQTAPIKVAVAAPVNAESGTYLDLILVARGKADSDMQGLLRFVADVDADQDLMDEAAEAPRQEAPGPALVSLLVLLGVLVMAGRRRF